MTTDTTATERELRELLRADAAPDTPNSPIEWDALLELATRHNVLPLLHQRIRGRNVAPPNIEAKLAAAYSHSGARNALLLHELSELLKTWRAAGLATVVLKGAALATTLYGDVALRPMTDLDVLHRKADAPAAIERALALGFAREDVETHSGDALAFENEVTLVKRRAVVVAVETHWSLFNSPHYQRALDMNWFWETAQPLTINGAPALVLGAEAQLLHLSAHLMLHHQGIGLLWWHDIALLLRACADTLNWNLVIAKSHEFDLSLALRAALERAKGEWGAPVPEFALTALARVAPSPREADVFAAMTTQHRPVARRLADDLRALPSWRARARFAWSNAFPSAAYMRARYGVRHRALLPLSYPYRWMLGAASAVSRKP